MKQIHADAFCEIVSKTIEVSRIWMRSHDDLDGFELSFEQFSVSLGESSASNALAFGQFIAELHVNELEDTEFPQSFFEILHQTKRYVHKPSAPVKRMIDEMIDAMSDS